MAQQEQEMTFWAHLETLRYALFRAAAVIAVLFCICFYFMPELFDSIVMGPTTSNFFLYRWFSGLHGDGTWFPDFSDQNFKVDIININVATQFMMRISTSFYFALVLGFPYLIYEIWRFVLPALYEHERHSVSLAFMGGTVMFFLGCALGYCVIFPFTFRFLTQYELSAAITNQISLNSYMNNFLMLILLMGAVFELPLLTWLLSKLGVITRSFLRRYRRHAVVLLLVLAAIITPTGDPFTLMLVFVPLYMLYEISIFISQDKRDEEEDEAEDESAK